MSRELLTPPKSRQESEEPGHKDDAEAIGTTTSLLRDLDRLLERYLHLLDRHQTLQAELGKQFSSVSAANN
jgi:coiled-coil domain-containing protein 115